VFLYDNCLIDITFVYHFVNRFRLHLPGKLKEGDGEETGSYDIIEGTVLIF